MRGHCRRESRSAWSYGERNALRDLAALEAAEAACVSGT